jgi:hypothetical protein
MKSKYTKIKYTNTGVKSPVVTLMKSKPDLDRTDMIELRYSDIIIVISRVLRKTMYNKAESRIEIRTKSNTLCAIVRVKDTINDAKIMVENYYIFAKLYIYLSEKKYISDKEYRYYEEWSKILCDRFNHKLYDEIMGVLKYVKES